MVELRLELLLLGLHSLQVLPGRLLSGGQLSLLELGFAQFGLEVVHFVTLLGLSFIELQLQLFDVFFGEGTSQIDFINGIADEEFGRLHNGFEAEIKKDLTPVSARWPFLLEDLTKLHQVLQVVHKPRVLLILKSPFDLDVASSEVQGALLLTAILVVLFHVLELLLHLLFQLLHESGLDVANGCLGEEFDGGPLGSMVLVLELLLK